MKQDNEIACRKPNHTNEFEGIIEPQTLNKILKLLKRFIRNVDSNVLLADVSGNPETPV